MKKIVAKEINQIRTKKMELHFCDKCGKQIFLHQYVENMWGRAVGGGGRSMKGQGGEKRMARGIGQHEVCGECYVKFREIVEELEKAKEKYYERQRRFFEE